MLAWLASGDAMTWQTLFGLLDAPKDKPSPRRQRLGLQDAGELVQLLASPEPAKCPHCGKDVPPPKLKLRRRRLYAMTTAAGALLHLEIDP
jgi:hypothetical protein